MFQRQCIFIVYPIGSVGKTMTPVSSINSTGWLPALHAATTLQIMDYTLQIIWVVFILKSNTNHHQCDVKVNYVEYHSWEGRKISCISYVRSIAGCSWIHTTRMWVCKGRIARLMVKTMVNTMVLDLWRYLNYFRHKVHLFWMDSICQNTNTAK